MALFADGVYKRVRVGLLDEHFTLIVLVIAKLGSLKSLIVLKLLCEGVHVVWQFLCLIGYCIDVGVHLRVHLRV